MALLEQLVAVVGVAVVGEAVMGVGVEGVGVVGVGVVGMVNQHPQLLTQIYLFSQHLTRI